MFLAKDVAEWIEHSQADVMVKAVDEDEKLTLTILSSGQNREMWFLTEQGLYEVLMQSRKPIAKEFKREVKKILKSIRQNGGYIVGQDTISDDELLERALIVAKNKLAQREKEVKVLQEENLQNKPKVLFADSVSASETSILIGQLAKLIKQNGVDMGQNRLFQWLRDYGYLSSRKGSDFNTPTQKSMDLGVLELKETSITDANGSVRICRTPKITGKGQIYFIDKIIGKKEETI